MFIINHYCFQKYIISVYIFQVILVIKSPMESSTSTEVHEKLPIIVEEAYIVNSKQIHFLLIKPYGASFLLWIGESNIPKFSDLSLSVAKNSTSIIGDDTHLLSNKLSLKLSNRFNESKPVYVSFNLPSSIQTGDFLKNLDDTIISFLNKHIKK